MDLNSKLGNIFYNGTNINTLNLNALRLSIGIVNQEPTLFAMSIKDNIKYGATDDNITDKDIMNAAKEANAHDFICNLPNRFILLLIDCLQDSICFEVILALCKESSLTTPSFKVSKKKMFFLLLFRGLF